MSNMRFTHPQSIKAKGLLVAAALCLVAVGCLAYFGMQKGIDAVKGQDTAQVSSDTDDNNLYTHEIEDIGAWEEEPQNPSSQKQQPTSSQEQKPQESVETVTQAAGFFVLPVTGEIIKDFSDSKLQYSMTYNDWRMHTAVDIKAPQGTPINAAGDGTVIEIYDDREYGKTVVINHGNDITAIYSGLDEISVAVGDVVAVNMQIATLGKVPCESVETTHLHFAMKKGEKYIAPLEIMGV